MTLCSLVLAVQVELSDSTSHTITDAYAGKEYIIQVTSVLLCLSDGSYKPQIHPRLSMHINTTLLY